MSPKMNTGKILEDMLEPVLRLNGYTVQPQKVIGEKIGGGNHRVDMVARSPDGRTSLISLKWQQTSGTAQEKVPFEVIKLIDAVRKSNGTYQHAHLVLGGEGWTPQLKDFYVNGGLAAFIRGCELISIHTLEKFIALVNRQEF